MSGGKLSSSLCPAKTRQNSNNKSRKCDDLWITDGERWGIVMFMEEDIAR